MTKHDWGQQVRKCDQQALAYYQQRLQACIRKNFAAGVTHWLARIHDLEQRVFDQ